MTKPDYKTTLTASSLSEQARFHQEVIRETKRLAEKAIQDFVEVRIGKIEEEAKIEIANILPRAIAEATQACNSSRPLEQTHSKFAQQETAANSLFRPANISSSAKSISLSTPIARRNSAVPASQPFSSSIAQPISMQRRMTTANIREDMAELPGEPLQLLSCSANANTSKALQEQKQGFRTQHGAGFGTQPPLASLQQQSSGFKRLQDSLLQPQMTRNPFRRSVNPSMNAEVPTTVAPSVTKTRSMAKPNLQRESAATISTPQYSPTAHYGPRVVTNQNTPRTQSISGPASTFNSPSMSHTNARQNQIMKTHHSNQRFDTPHELNSNAHFTSQYNQHPSATSRLRQGYYHSAQFDQASSVQTNPNYPVFKPYSNNPQISATQSSLSQHNHNSNLGLQHGQGLSTTERPNELRPQPSWIARAPDLFEDLRNIQMSQDARRGFDQSINEETEQQMAQDGNVEMDFNGDIDFTQDGDFYQGISQDLTLSHDMSQSLFDWDNFESLPRRV
jgi:hypothetical protein